MKNTFTISKNSTKENIKEILKSNQTALRGMHDVFGYDFCKPFKIVKICGNFTVNSICKIAEKNGYSTDEKSQIVILTRRTDTINYYHSTLKAVEILGNDFNVKFTRRIPHYHNCKHMPFDDFYAKSCFHDFRKETDCETYIFLQSSEFKKLPKESKLNLNERFKIKKVNYCRDINGKKRINEIDIIRTEGKGEKFTYEVSSFYGSWNKPQEEDVNYFFDKSGYYARERRESLINRAKQIRAERKKEEYKRIDNSCKIEELQQLIDNKKMEIVQQLINAKTSDDIRTVEKSLAYWKGLGGIYSDFERYVESSKAKKYNSIEESDSAYNYIKRKINGENVY